MKKNLEKETDENVGRDKVRASDNMYAFELWVDIDHCGMSTRKHVIYAKASTHLLW